MEPSVRIKLTFFDYETKVLSLNYEGMTGGRDYFVISDPDTYKLLSMEQTSNALIKRPPELILYDH